MLCSAAAVFSPRFVSPESSITRPGAEIHGYEPTPSDIRNAANADLVIVNGLGLDDWFTAFTEASGAPHITATDGIEVIPIANGEYAGYANPHAWMAPSHVTRLRWDSGSSASFETNS